MTTTTLDPPSPRARVGTQWPALFGLGWSLFGVLQFARESFRDAAELTAAGMTDAQATLYAGLPAWMTLAFAVGVFGGVVGSALLLAGRRAAVPVLIASLGGYLVLFAGDALLGVFAVFGAPQVAVLCFVVAVAAALVRIAQRDAAAARLR